MDTDFKSLEKRYGTSLAMKICEEIAKAEQRHFNYYNANLALRSMKRVSDYDVDYLDMPQTRVA